MSSLKRIDRSLIGVVGTLFAFSVLAIGLAPPANADTVYTYTGNVFDSFKGNFECPPECRIMGSFTLAQPLPPNLTFVTISPKSFSFTDGMVTLTPANSFHFIHQPFGDFSTDATGAITTWAIEIDGKQPLGFPFLITRNLGLAADETGLLLKVGASNTNNPGMWSAITTNTPEPSCLLLLCTGLLSIVGATGLKGSPLPRAGKILKKFF
jgi:hypothetical protein